MSWTSIIVAIVIIVAFFYGWKFISPMLGNKASYIYWLIILVVILYVINWLKFNLTYFPIITDSVSGKQIYTKTFSYLPNSSDDYGFGFTLGFKILINDWDYRFNQEKVVIQQGDNYNVVLDKKTNKLLFNIAIYPVNGQSFITIPIEGIPLNIWNSYMIAVQGRNIDIWQKIDKPQLLVSKLAPNVLKVDNNKSFMVGMDGGFGGEIKNVVYYSYPLSRKEIISYI